MTDDEREELLTTLQGMGKAIEQSGDERDVATAACLYALCFAIREGVEGGLARHILFLEGVNLDLERESPSRRGH